MSLDEGFLSNQLGEFISNLVWLLVTAVAIGIRSIWRKRTPFRTSIGVIVIPIVLWAVSTIVALLLYRYQYMVGALLLLGAASLCGNALLIADWRKLSRIGVVGGESQLDTGLDFEKALALCNDEVWFLGIGASKLTGRKSFEDAVRRCNRKEFGNIRFLLMRPESPILKTAAKQAGKPVDEYIKNVRKSLEILTALRRDKNLNIEVRFLRDTEVAPPFRLMFIDDKYCSVSYYHFGEGDGTHAPQVLLSKGEATRNVDSFYYPFRELFLSLWKSAEPWSLDKVTTPKNMEASR